MSYVKGLDGLRAFAILLVIIHHSHFLLQEGVLAVLSKFFGCGVDLFFVVSGYLITSILIRSKGQEGYFRKFYFRRFLRIIPLYYAILIFAFYIIPLIQNPELSKLKSTVAWPYWTFLSNYFIAWKGKFDNGLIDLSWSLSVEEQFYVFWSFCVYFCDRRQLRKIAISILIICPAIRFALFAYDVNYVAIHVMSITRMDTLMMGALLAMQFEKDTFEERRIVITLCLAVLAFIGTLYLPLIYRMGIGYSVLSLIFSCIVALVIKANTMKESALLRFLEFRPLVLMGIYSYGIYLFHNPIQKALRNVSVSLFQVVGFNILSQQIVFYFIVTTISFLLAGLSYHLYESQWLKYKNKFN